jgi:hypothetical protein
LVQGLFLLGLIRGDGLDWLKRIVLSVLFAAFVSNASFGQEAASVGEAVTVARQAGSLEQRAWLAASPQARMRMAEKLGDDGARTLARQRGLQPIFDGLDRTIPQGPDQVYRASNGRIVVYEAKGGSSVLSLAYGHAQGSPEWAVKSAERLLNSSQTSQLEKAAARQIIEAAASRNLDVHMVRTKHTLGLPTSTVAEAEAATTEPARKLAKQLLASLPQGSKASPGAKVPGGAKGVLRGLVVVGVAVDANQRIETIREVNQALADGQISVEKREVVGCEKIT